MRRRGGIGWWRWWIRLGRSDVRRGWVCENCVLVIYLG